MTDEEKEYTPFGEEWIKEVMKLPKRELVEFFKNKCKENAKLKEQNKDLCESLDIMNNRESELLDQIEKMKCCQNCQHCGLTEDNTLECFAEHEINTYICECWELAE